MKDIPLPGDGNWDKTIGYTNETPLKCNGTPDPSYSLQGERTIGEVKENIQKVAVVLHDEYQQICYDLIGLTSPESKIRQQWNGDDLTRMFAAFFMRNKVKDVLMEKRPLTMKSEAVVRILTELTNLGTVSFQEDILSRLEAARQKFHKIVQSNSKTTLKQLNALVESLD